MPEPTAFNLLRAEPKRILTLLHQAGTRRLGELLADLLEQDKSAGRCG